jgi:menaquinone-9 beta-reductase
MTRALVIGAGPAGSIAAICLARRGIDVTLVEQHRFSRDKVCGECISSLGMDVLKRLGLCDEIRKAGAVELAASALYGPAGESATVALPKPMWGLTRRRLDELLLHQAIRAGAKLQQPARCESIAGAQVKIRSLIDNSVSVITADRIFLADGKGALLDRRPEPTGDFGIKAHFDNVTAPENKIGLYALHGHYVGVARVENGIWNLAFSAPLAKVRRFERDFDGLLREAMRENAALADHLQFARRAGDWLTSPLPRFGVNGDWPLNVIPIGNAAAALEPIGGEGMGLAMRSAELAVEHMDSQQGVKKQFVQLWDLRRAACRLAAIAMSRPALSGAVVELLAANDALAGRAMQLMGKL